MEDPEGLLVTRRLAYVIRFGSASPLVDGCECNTVAFTWTGQCGQIKGMGDEVFVSLFDWARHVEVDLPAAALVYSLSLSLN